MQGTVVDEVLSTRESRVAWFASVELTVNCVTAVIQVLFTGHAIRRFGIGPMLALLPVVVMMGFFGLGLFPTLGMVFAFQVVRRASEFALARPARESLFTVVSREDKYKAKNLIDTFAFRGGDAAGAASFSLLTSRWIGLGVSGVLWLCLPIGALGSRSACSSGDSRNWPSPHLHRVTIWARGKTPPVTLHSRCRWRLATQAGVRARQNCQKRHGRQSTKTCNSILLGRDTDR